MSHQRAPSPSPGDVYASPLPDGRFGAVRVLRVTDGSSLVAVTPWIGDAPPSLEESLLCEVLVENRLHFEDNEVLVWCSGRPTEGLVHVGNISPTRSESARECATHGKWHDAIALRALLEWRWEHDREAFLAEIEAQKAEPPPQRDASEHPPMLDLDEFWRLISRLNWRRTGNDDAVISPVVVELTRRPVEDILGFEERLAHLLYQLDGEAYAREIGEWAWGGPGGYFSPDWFLYVRCCVVANGRETFMRVKRDPKQMLKDLEFEALLTIAEKAYEAKTGEEWDHVTRRDYETGSNRRGWGE